MLKWIYVAGFVFCGYVASQAMEIKKVVLPDINRDTEIAVINYQAKIVPVKKKIVTVTIKKGN